MTARLAMLVGSAVMFFIVHYGDGEMMLLNSNCQCKVLLENIKKRCKAETDDEVDVADMQACVQRLADLPATKYASDIIQPRGNYILIKVNRRIDEFGQFCKEYVPLLKGLELVNPEFLSRLVSRKVNPDAYSKDGKDGAKNANRTGKRGATSSDNRQGTSMQKTKASSANLSSGGGQKKGAGK